MRRSSLGDSMSLLSILPVAARSLDRSRAGRAMLWAPIVGLVLAVIADVFIFFTRFAIDPHLHHFFSYVLGHQQDASAPEDIGPLPAAVGIGVLALLTRGLHLDGLADTTDALASYKAKDDSLEIMRKPDLGPLGMVAVLLTVIVQVFALSRCIEIHRGSCSLIVAAMTGRIAMLRACTPSTPPARPDGLGALVAGTVRNRSAQLATAAAVVLAVAIAFADIHSLGRYKEATEAGLALLVGSGVGYLIRRHCVRRLGGITGDVLGAICELATAAALLVMASGGS